MTSRQLKTALKNGEWVKAYQKPPLPPQEWGKHRQERMQVAIACAVMHFIGDKDLTQIADHFRKKGYMEAVTKQRVSQYVNKAMKFLVDRGMFMPAPK